MECGECGLLLSVSRDRLKAELCESAGVMVMSSPVSWFGSLLIVMMSWAGEGREVGVDAARDSDVAVGANWER